jgi:hypothetical protein
MNPRIKELALEAGAEFWQRLEDGVVKENAYVTFDPPESLEKFAMLVIQDYENDMRESRREVKSQLGYSRIGLGNV